MKAGQDVRGISSVTDFSVYNFLGTVLQLISDSGLDSHLKHWDCTAGIPAVTLIYTRLCPPEQLCHPFSLDISLP